MILWSLGSCTGIGKLCKSGRSLHRTTHDNYMVSPASVADPNGFQLVVFNDPSFPTFGYNSLFWASSRARPRSGLRHCGSRPDAAQHSIRPPLSRPASARTGLKADPPARAHLPSLQSMIWGHSCAPPCLRLPNQLSAAWPPALHRQPPRSPGRHALLHQRLASERPLGFGPLSAPRPARDARSPILLPGGCVLNVARVMKRGELLRCWPMR